MNLKDFQRKASRLAGRAAQKGSDLLETGKTKIAIGKEEHAIWSVHLGIIENNNNFE